MRSRGGFVVVLLVVGAALIALWRFGPPQMRLHKERLVVAESGQMMSALIFVAIADGLFERKGLQVDLRAATNGRVALQDMLDGEADLALSSDVPAANAIGQDRPIRILATIETSDRDVAITTPTGTGITTAADLRGRRIGFIPGTNSEYFLDLLTRQSGLGEDFVKRPYDNTTIMKALADGEVDAVSAWTTVRLAGSHLFPDGLQDIAAPGLYTESWVLSTRSDVVEAHRPALAAFLQALIEAEQVILSDRKHAIPIVAAATGLPADLVGKYWDSYGYTLRLDQALLLSLESHVRRSGGNPGSALLHFLQLDLLKAADPSRVTIPG